MTCIGCARSLIGSAPTFEASASNTPSAPAANSGPRADDGHRVAKLDRHPPRPRRELRGIARPDRHGTERDRVSTRDRRGDHVEHVSRPLAPQHPVAEQHRRGVWRHGAELGAGGGWKQSEKRRDGAGDPHPTEL